MFVGAAALVGLVTVAPSAAEPRKSSGHDAPAKSSPDASDPKPAFGPAPSWVKTEAPASVSAEDKDSPLAFLLSDSQEMLTPAGLKNYVEYVVQPLNEAGLQAVGNVTIPWNVQRANLTINQITIERGGRTIDALERNEVSVLRRETKLEQSTLDGIRTVVMPIKGLEIGDKLHVAFTLDTKLSGLGKTEEVQDLAVPIPIERMVRRLLVSKDLSVRWQAPPGTKQTSTVDPDGTIERTYVVEAAQPVKAHDYMPERYKHAFIQASAFDNWAEVAAVLAPKFDVARKTAPDSDVAKVADKIAASTKDPAQRMLAALRTAQDQVRYVALLLGDGDYKPMPADEVWERRYGDCKGKTAFLLALLDRLGINAEPVLASVKYDDGLEGRLPSLALLDHVYVRAHLGDQVYYLDGTQFGQRTLEELRNGTTTHILPVASGSTLVTIPDAMPSAPLMETDLTWDARNGILGKVPFDATLVLRGPAAADMRVQAAQSTDRDKLIEAYKNKVAGVANDDLKFVSADPEASDGSYVVHFNGAVELDWRPVEGLKGNRLELSQSTLKWTGDFDRSDEAAKNIPVKMAFPYWERMNEKVMLPAGGKDFTVDADPIDKTVAVTQLIRTVTMKDGTVTAISDFKRLKRELDPQSVPGVKDELSQIGSDFAYVVSKKKLKLSQ